MSSLPEWPRPYYKPGGANPALFYVVFGRLDLTTVLSRSKYRSNGIPKGISGMTYGPDVQPQVVASFKEGHLWSRLTGKDTGLAVSVASQDSCLTIKGEVNDPPTLAYLRDAVGFLTYSLDIGGVAIVDLLTMKWWTPAEWRSLIFDVGAPVPNRHVEIFYSEDESATTWIHTRGLRKFGRPDLSIHRTPARYSTAAVDLCNRFIELLALGGEIPEGQEIKMRALPPGMRCFNRGSDDDPDFNNRHIEVEWPVGVEVSG